jgi:hypothetical protein
MYVVSPIFLNKNLIQVKKMKNNWAVFGSCYQWARKPQNYPITASYIGGLTPIKKVRWLTLCEGAKSMLCQSKGESLAATS